jgi:processive 1,2-diacylglycerol beta-glucosyltransferase
MTTPDNRSRILILHAQAGAGHKRAAESLELAFRAVDRGIQVHALDTMLFASRLLKRTYAQTYNTMVKRAPRFKRVHQGTSRARVSVDRFNLRRLVKAIERFQPAALICTHFLPLSPLAHLAKKGKLGAPLYCVVTDFGGHPVWAYEGVTGYFVASAEGREDLADWGVPWDNVRVTGIPIDPRFSTLVPERDARTDMGQRLLALDCQPQVVVIAGRNEEMLARLQQLEDRHPESMRAIGFTDEVDRWLDTADVNVTKPGGLTSSETLAKQVPMVIYRPTPGQEDRNSQALTTVGAALRARTLDHVVEAVDRVLSRPALARTMQDACRFLGRPGAAVDIAKYVIGDTDTSRGQAASVTVRGETTPRA